MPDACSRERGAHLSLVESSEAAVRHERARNACAVERHRPRRRAHAGPALGVALMLCSAILVTWGLYLLADWLGWIKAAAAVAGPILALAQGPVAVPPGVSAKNRIALERLARLQREADALRDETAQADDIDADRAQHRLQVVFFAVGVLCGCVLMACALSIGRMVAA